MTPDTTAHDFLIECGLTDDEADSAIALANAALVAELRALHAPGVTGNDGQWCTCGVHLYADCPNVAALDRHAPTTGDVA